MTLLQLLFISTSSYLGNKGTRRQLILSVLLNVRLNLKFDYNNRSSTRRESKKLESRKEKSQQFLELRERVKLWQSRDFTVRWAKHEFVNCRPTNHTGGLTLTPTSYGPKTNTCCKTKTVQRYAGQNALRKQPIVFLRLRNSEAATDRSRIANRVLL